MQLQDQHEQYKVVTVLPSGLVVTVGAATVAAPEPATTTLLFNFALASVDKSATTLLPEAVVVMYLPLSAPTTPKLKPPFWFNFLCTSSTRITS